MPGTVLPAFPDDVPTHPLLVVDFQLIKSKDVQEVGKLWKAATELGFWYLKNHGAEQEVEGMFDMAEETLALPMQEKVKFGQGDDGRPFGYKPSGASATDEYGSPDTVEYFNISKDDALSYPAITHRIYPSTVISRMESTIRPFVQKSIEVNNTIIGVFEGKLGLPTDSLLKRHALEDASGSEARCIKNPPRQNHIVGEKEGLAIGAHTDFGSLSFLHNRLGGLQVLPPGYETWQYVRPLPGHAICNIGDALTLFSGGILRSNLHRVVPSPGDQASHVRWSLVFFTRPGNDVPLRALTNESEKIMEKITSMPPEERKRFEPGATAKEWYARRVSNQRIKNMKGPETYRASRGTERNERAIY